MSSNFFIQEGLAFKFMSDLRKKLIKAGCTQMDDVFIVPAGSEALVKEIFGDSSKTHKST